MKKLLALFITLFTSFLLGVKYVEPENKILIPGKYYVGNSKEDIDYKSMFNAYQYGNVNNKNTCDKAIQRLNTTDKIIIPKGEKNYRWFWSTTTEGEEIFEILTDTTRYKLEDGTYLFELPNGTKLITPASCNLVASSKHIDECYPKDKNTRGIFIQTIIKEDKTAYKLTYGSMSKWWCCMNKAEPDKFIENDKDKPVYTHSLDFSNKDSFKAGTVLGLTGITGIPKDNIKNSLSYLLLTIEKTTVTDDVINENWTKITIDEFYKLN